MKEIFMANREDDVRTRITVEQYDKRYIIESPYSDTNIIEELPDLVYDILLMSGYTKDTINQAFIELAQERGYKFDGIDEE